MRPVRIVFYGNFGAGNLGNEVTLQTAIAQTLARLPEAELLCVCPNPDDVRARHGIAATASLSRDFGWSWSDLEAGAAGGAQDDAATRDRTRAGRNHPLGRVGTALRRVGRILFRRMPAELGHWYRMLRLVARSDMLLVPGTGIVTDGAGVSLGWPYDMFKLALLARVCGKRVIFLSVGAGPFHHRLGRWFVRRGLGLAHYRSYRDVDSRRRLEAIGFNAAHDAICPDLVFVLSGDHLAGAGTANASGRVVGLGLKDYATPVDDSDAQGYRDYLGAMADFVVWLQAQGWRVRLIIGDAQYDTRVREDLIALLEARGAGARAPLLLSDPVPTVAELLRQLGETDAVISPRFHNLVLALMLDKPVIALSDLPKVTALIVDLGLGRFCLGLEGLRMDELTACFARLQAEAGPLKSYIRQAVGKYRHAVDEQYAKVYASLADERRVGRAG